ncbi:unnamed protein product [Closterium sp. NIES-53]
MSICTCTRTGHHPPTFTRRPESSLYTPTTEPPHLAASSKVFASGPVAAPGSCRLLSHRTLFWHHRLSHPLLLCFHGMHSRLLVSGLPKSLPPLLPSPAPPCLPCVEGRQRAAPHSSSFPPTTAHLQTLHMDSVSSSASGFARTFLSCVCTLTEVRLIGLVMEVARTSMIHAAAPHFLWSFAVWYAAHQLNLWLRVSLPETAPTLHWTGKLSSRAIPCVFLGFPPDAHGWQFYHPTSRRVLPSQDVTFDDSKPFYRLFPYRTAPLPPPPPLFLAPGPPPVDPLPPQGPAPSGVSQVDPLPLVEPVEVIVDSGAARGAAYGGAEPASAEPRCAEPASSDLGVLSLQVRSLGVLSLRVRSLGVLSVRVRSLGMMSLRVRSLEHTRLRSGAAGAGGPVAGGTGAGGAGATSPGGARVTAGAGGTRGAVAAGFGGARTRGNGAAGAGGV